MAKRQSKLAIFFLGPPGAGKDTQAGLLAKKLNLTLLSSGDIVRKNIKNDPAMKKIYEAGRLTPPKIMVEWTKEAIDVSKSFVFSGALRTLREAKELMLFLRENGYKIKIFNIEISSVETIKRNLLRARDIIDTEDRIKERLKVYDEQTKPVLDFLGKQVTQINGEQTIKNTHKDIVNAGGWQNIEPDNVSTCQSCQARCPFAGIK